MGRWTVALRPAVTVLIILVLVLGVLWLVQRKLIYFPDGSPVPSAERVEGGSDVTLHTSDGLRLGAWQLSPRLPDRRVAVLVANGNAGNRAMRLPLARALADQGFTVLLFDYRGYGGNGGSPSESGFALDARAAYRHLATTFPAERVIFYGESLGAAVVTELATEHRPGGLVLRSPFASMSAVAAHHYPFLPVRVLLRDRYPLADQVSTIKTPTLIVYGSADATVPPAQSRTVARQAAGPVTVVAIAGADHNDASLLAGPELITAIVALADRMPAR